jgi:HPt (histidine-containing phosphotransfer) domain-containing protein
MAGPPRESHNRDVHLTDQAVVLDRRQLRDITLDDEGLIREVLTALLDDTSKQIALLDHAIRDRDPQKTMRLAHYCKGACANIGANAVATVLQRLEQQAARQSFTDCAASLESLTRELERLRLEAVTCVGPPGSQRRDGVPQ